MVKLQEEGMELMRKKAHRNLCRYKHLFAFYKYPFFAYKRLFAHAAAGVDCIGPFPVEFPIFMYPVDVPHYTGTRGRQIRQGRF